MSFTKANPGVFDIYADLEPNEPYFLLRGRDVMAPMFARFWAWHRLQMLNQGMLPSEEAEQIRSAQQCASEMERFYREYLGRKAGENLLFNSEGYVVAKQLPDGNIVPAGITKDKIAASS